MNTTALSNADQEKAQRPLTREHLINRFKQVRQASLDIVEPLEPEDFTIQVMTNTSPTKWHLAHVSWFFETFVLSEIDEDYESLHPQYSYIFNSYYLQTGQPHDRSKRGFLSRPTVREVMEYRRYVNENVIDFLKNASEDQLSEFGPVIEIGNNHEQQHQELMITDFKFMFAQNPLYPVYREKKLIESDDPGEHNWVQFDGGIHEIGNAGEEFIYDNEQPRHRRFLEPFKLGTRLVTNAEFMEFMNDDVYNRSELWLDDGWSTLNENDWEAPLYWCKRDGKWYYYTLSGLREVDPNEPVTHVSYYEADAFARWAGARLPTEAEWEVAAADKPYDGNFVENENFHPLALQQQTEGLNQMYGDVWEWTKSSYDAYPGYQPLEGALGEYNGKFMCSQYVLRGGSCATSKTHIRKTYRNFFYPDARWQFNGIRLAKHFNILYMIEKSLADSGDMLDEILKGLKRTQKSLPSKLFYDERGSLLFEQITHLEEYYLTRAERQIMQQNIGEITDAIGENSVIIEPGSGNSEKMRFLLDNLPALRGYIPVDISREYLSEVVDELRHDYPDLLIKPVCADYTKPFSLPKIEKSFDYYVVYYPGSTIGNFQPEEAQNFLKMLAEFMIPGGGLLIGVDLQKNKQILEAAYNDSEEITAAFNKNILLYLNREFKADFILDKFDHLAFYNEQKDRIEMHLQSNCDQTVQIGDASVHFSKDETIHTESSYKYSLESFRLLVNSWFNIKKVWTDDKKLFSLQYLVKK